jgi:chromate transporter
MLGVVAFGGPAAHVNLMRREIVERYGWIEERDFLQMFAACNLVPGPSSTELAIYIGYRLVGVPGLILAGLLFILPATTLMLVIAVLYSHFGQLSRVQAALNGVSPVVVAVIVWALWDLSKRVLITRASWVGAAAAFAVALAGVNPIVILVLGGVLGVAISRWGGRLAQVSVFMPVGLVPVNAWGSSRLVALFLTFLKLGAVSFGSGYVLFAFLHADLVETTHWITSQQLIDAVAIGQATPGPVFTTATFLGYLIYGVPGAVLATVAIFFPGFCFVPFLDRIVTVVRRHAPAHAFLDGVNVGVLGLIAAVCVQLGTVAIHDALTAVLALIALPILVWRPPAAPLVIALGAVIGVLASIA